MKPLLEIRDLSLSVTSNRQKLPILRSMELTIAKSEIVAIVGETGSGKTLTAKTVMGILPKNAIVESGRIIFDDVELVTSADRRGALQKIAMVFQNPMTSMNPLFKVGEQMNDVIKWSLDSKSSLTKDARLEKIASALQQVRLGTNLNILEMYPFQLSGGMRQRVMLAMALLRNPLLLIADEPTTALDVTTQKEILDLLKELVQRNEMSLLLITHNLGIAFETANRTYVLYAGQVVEEGSTASIFASPKHPYTRGLIESIPSLDGSRSMAGISGEISQIDRETNYCCFASRCSYVIDRCRKERPNLEPIGESHSAACFVAKKTVMPN
ncbi:MAG: ABC transporter ATP-binding protein [Nitrososphaerota archaeon]|nr:ABC transporter ATP-binding protein [Nitrososphaerota archaeon]